MFVGTKEGEMEWNGDDLEDVDSFFDGLEVIRSIH